MWCFSGHVVLVYQQFNPHVLNISRRNQKDLKLYWQTLRVHIQGMKILLVANKVYKQEPHDNINGYTFHTTITTSSNSIMWHLPCHCYTCRDGCVKRSHFYVVVLAYALCQPVTPPFLVCELCLPVAPCIFLINNYSSFSAVPPTHFFAVDASSMHVHQ